MDGWLGKKGVERERGRESERGLHETKIKEV